MTAVSPLMSVFDSVMFASASLSSVKSCMIDLLWSTSLLSMFEACDVVLFLRSKTAIELRAAAPDVFLVFTFAEVILISFAPLFASGLAGAIVLAVCA